VSEARAIPRGLVAVALGAALALSPETAAAQTAPADGSLTLRAVQIFGLITLLSVAPAIAVMATCFPFMVTVLSILRTAVGLQQSPPNMLIVSLALFLTWFVMAPVFETAWRDGVSPLVEERVSLEEGVVRALAPFRTFMTSRVDADTLAALEAVAPAPIAPPAAAGGAAPSPAPALDLQAPDADAAPPDETPLSILAPAFLLSEIARAFEIGFLIYLPFLLIDLVVASILMSMGMMMVPPAVVSLPFKLAFFVAADGWSLLAGALIRGYGP
jgi:flagellar biosynthetic protein FliP